jgi:eukaryotic-like serine/threonine-protein kinase
MLKLLTCVQGHFWEIPQPSGNGELPDLASLHCPVCGSPADELPLIDLAPSDTVPVTPEARRVPPKPPLVDAEGNPIVSGYEILEALGKSKKGVALYRAKQVLINRQVLLKVVLARDDAGQIAWGALRGEANTLAKIAHPNIPQIHEVGERERQLFYNVVELFDGEPLPERQRGKPFPPLRAVKFIENVARALHFAHAKGVVHRSLKPTSILVEITDDKPLDQCAFKITDFGLASRPVEGDVNDLELQDKLPHYLSPEQAWGYVKDIGPGTDVYALGVLLYELLTGRPPYRGERASEIVEQIRSRPPTPPRHVNPKVPEDLDAICRKCLQKPPRKRYASALALAEDLRRYQEGRPIQAHDNGLGTRLLKWVGRQPAVACILVLLFLLFVSTLAAFAISLNQRESESYGFQPVLRDEQAARNELGGLQKALAQSREREQLVQYYHDIARAEVAVKENRFDDALAILNACPVPPRAWEWHYLESLGKQIPPQTLPALPGPITCIAFHPSGALLAIGVGSKPNEESGSVYVWHLSGDHQLFMRDFKAPVYDLAFRPDGDSLAVLSAAPKGNLGGGSGQLHILHAFRGEPLRPLEQLPGRGRSLAYSPDGRFLAIGGDQGKPWLVEDDGAILVGIQRGEFKPFNRPFGQQSSKIVHMAFSPDGQRLAYGSEDLPEVSVLDCPFGNNRGVIRTQFQGVAALAFAPDGRLAVGWRNGEVRIWDSALTERKVLAPFNGKVNRVLFSSDGKRLAVLGPGLDGKSLLRWYDGNSQREIFSLPGLDPQVNAIALDKQGRRLAVVSANRVKIYGARTNP